MGAPAFDDYAESDFPVLAALWVETWRDVFPQIDFTARRDWLALHLADLLREGAHIRLLREGADLLGFVSIDPASGYIDQLAVAKSRQGSGAAARLIAEAVRLSPEKLELLVNRDNARAVRFYEKHGFIRIGAEVSPVSGLPLWRYRRDA